LSGGSSHEQSDPSRSGVLDATPVSNGYTRNMTVSRRYLKNDPDRLMYNNVLGTHVWMSEKNLQALNPKALDGFIEDLRKGEAMTRKLRERLEALRSKSARKCPSCGRPVVGRSDAIYCTTPCRIKAHRESRRNDSSRNSEASGS
jgi:hypothetical protein